MESEARVTDLDHESKRESCTAPVLSFIIPAYNEHDRIRASLATAHGQLSKLPYSFELLVVDDGSDDDTFASAQSFADEHLAVTVIAIPHAGKAAAVRAGMRQASGCFLLFSDADLATPLSYVSEFVSRAHLGADVVIASREGPTAERIGEPHYRHFMGRVFNRLVQLLLLPGIEDTQCGFKLFTQVSANQILDRTLLYTDTVTQVAGARVTAFDVEMLVIARRLGMSIDVVPVEWTYGTQSKVNPLTDTIMNVRDILQVKLNDLRNTYDNPQRKTT
jgi:dolichyl-phosphate beta-glucosyltransferase